MMRVEIFKQLSDRGIKIPYPQRVVHFKNDDNNKNATDTLNH